MKATIPPFRRPQQRQGFILVLVLSLLVLITVLVVGFLSHTNSHSRSTASYRDETGNLLLSDVPVNIVKAQIDDATGASTATPVLWASQPGAIRSVATDGTQTTYKLYSSNLLTDINTGAALGTAITGDLPTDTAANNNDWASSPIWTDLNAPTLKNDGTSAYPIIDVVNDNADLPVGSTDSAPFATGSFNIVSGNPVGAVRSATGKYPLPMPVRWLYVLQQGQIIAPDSTSAGAKVTFATAKTIPSATNPIVGRVAFWTDDDTCRVNVNTASVNVNTNPDGSTATQGTFWDTPHFTATDDYYMATNQPANLEYQRYPGHPATTTLSLALPEFSPKPDPSSTKPVITNEAEKLLGLTPRYGTGGSMEGTVALGGASAPTVTPAMNRLYASVSELLFDPPPKVQGARAASSLLSKPQLETAKFFLTARSRAPELNVFGLPRVSIWPVSSVNDSLHRTPADQLIAFSSSTIATTGSNVPNNYYFTRYPYTAAPSLTGSNSPTYDIGIAGDGSNFNNGNKDLLSYVDHFTSLQLPGQLGGAATFDTKYSQLGKRQILMEMFDYIRITNSRDPGLDPASGGPAGSVPYSAPNAYDNSHGSTSGYGQIAPTIINPVPGWDGWNGTYGFGRFQGRVIEASIIFVGVGQGIPAGTTTYTSSNNYPVQAAQALTVSPAYTGITPAPAGTTSTLIPSIGKTAVQAMFVLTFFDPALGYSRATSYVDLQTSGIKSFKVTPSGSSAVTLFPNEDKERLGTLTGLVASYAYYPGANPASLGGLMDFRMMLGGRVGGYINGASPVVGDNNYPSLGNIINMPTGGTFAFNGGTITVTTYAGGNGLTIASTPAAPQIHQFNISFPAAASLPVPNYSFRSLFGSSGATRATTLPNTTTAATDRFDAIRSTSQNNGQYDCHLIDFANDTIISVVPAAAYGDYRMLCAPTTPTDGSAFNVSLYSGLAGTQRLGYGLRYPSGQVFPNGQYGSLVGAVPRPPSTLSYYSQDTSVGVTSAAYGSIPFVPATVSNPSAGSSTSGNAPPDFDNGFGELPDGPYINKPDEGAVYPAASGSRVYYDNAGTVIDTAAAPQFFFSPQRQVPSPVMFGSLPTGAPVNNSVPQPWQTLLFQPGMTGHKGISSPRDEYFLDFFWMPQAQPYAISEPFSTAGKVNLNYQIFPFTYIDRSTAVQSVLASEKVAQLPATVAPYYKKDSGNTSGPSQMPTTSRLSLNMSEKDGTLRGFTQRFNNFDFFKTAGEICEVYLVPLGQSWGSDTVAQSSWYGSDFALVGDNTREKPYADIYSRVTTKSNSFTVYYHVQALKNPVSASATQWTEGQGAILGDYRGSTTLERYIDPSDATVPDYANAANYSLPNLESHYKWRVVENTRFAP